MLNHSVDRPPETDSHGSFRHLVREFFKHEYPEEIFTKLRNGQTLGLADLQASERALSRKGWLAPGWPTEFGGPGWSLLERMIFDYEMGAAGAPGVVPMGLLYVAPVIYTFGSDEQKQRWLPDILSAKSFWAQGYSEPEAGSDLASLRMEARLEGASYRVNGEKIWTSQAQYADWIFCLVRTESTPRKQDGITFLCIELNSQGVQVHPIISIDGSHYLNRVTFDDVIVPIGNQIGDAGKGWSYARFLLGHERTSYARLGAKRHKLAALRETYEQSVEDGSLLSTDRNFRRKLVEAELATAALEATVERALAPLTAGQAPSNESSIIKILATETSQLITEIGVELAGPYASPYFCDRSGSDWLDGYEAIPRFAPGATADYFFTRAETIYGGSTEVQKNIISRLLGL